MTERTTSLPEFHVPPSLQQAAMPPRVEVEGIVQRYPAPEGKGEVTVLDGIDLTLEGRGINVLLGPSGCGKSTLMRMMGGVRPPDVKSPTEGTVKIDGAVCEGVHDDVVTVFQRYANRPDLSVEDNIRFPFRTKLWRDRVPLEEQNTRVEQMLKAVGLLEKRGLRPAQLSGGQNQRVALARALVLRPRVLLMDEPFGALDAQTREEMQRLLLEIIAEYHCLIVFITHDVEEALYLGDRVLVMSHPPAKVAEDFRNPQPVPRDRLWMQSTEGRALVERVRRRLGHIREVAE